MDPATWEAGRRWFPALRDDGIGSQVFHDKTMDKLAGDARSKNGETAFDD